MYQALEYEWKLCEQILTAGLKSDGPKNKDFLYLEWVTCCHPHIAKKETIACHWKYL